MHAKNIMLISSYKGREGLLKSESSVASSLLSEIVSISQKKNKRASINFGPILILFKVKTYIMLCPQAPNMLLVNVTQKRKKKELGTAYINPLVAWKTTVIPITLCDWFCQLKGINTAFMIKVCSFCHVLCKKNTWLPCEILASGAFLFKHSSLISYFKSHYSPSFS